MNDCVKTEEQLVHELETLRRRVSELEESDAARTETERLLTESEQRYKALVDNVAVGIFVVNPRMEIVEVNKTFQTYFPDVQSGSGQICYEQYNDPPRSEPCSFCPCVLTLQDGEVHEATMDTPINGEIRTFHVVSSPVKDSDGGIRYVIGLTQDITQTTRAEQFLRFSEERYRRLFDEAPLMYVITRNEQGTPFIEDCNELFLRSLGYEREEVVGQALADFYSPESRARLLEGGGYARALAGEFVMGERELLTHDGRLIPTLLYTMTEVDSAGKVIGTLAMFADITERKQAEAALRESEERFKQVAENAGEWIWELDAEGMYQYSSSAVKRILGYSPEELVGRKHYYDLFPSEVQGKLKETVQLAFERGDVFRGFLNPTVHKNGEIRLLETSGSPFRDDEGRLLGYRGVDTDITERTRAEEALREGEERYRSLFESMREGFAYCRMLYKDGAPRDFVYLEVNEAFERLTGLTDVVGRKVTEILPGIEESNPELLEIYGQVASTGIPEKFETYIDSLGIWLSLSVYSPREDYFIAVFDNVTERKRAEEALRKSEERLELALHGADLGLWDWNVRTGYGFANQRSAEIIGYSIDEIETTFDFWEKSLHPDDRQRAVERVFNCLSGSTDLYEDEYRVRHKSGDWKWILTRGKITERDPEGKPVRMTGTFLDVTDKKAAELQASEADDLREKIVEESPVGIAVYRADGQCIAANDSLGRIVGADKARLLEQNFRTLSSWKQSELLEQAEQVLTGGLTEEREIRLTSTFGKDMWVSSRMARFTSRGEPHLLMVLNDITERRVAEEALKFEREQILSLFESINEVIFVIDPTTYEILYANKFAEKLYGEGLTGGVCHQKLKGFDDPCGDCRNETIVELRGEPYQWEYSNSTLNKDFLATDRIIRWPDGRDVKFHIAIDITERKKAEQEQNRLKAQLFQAQKMESIGTLAGGIAHDFNNLLTIVLGFSELLMSDNDEQSPAYADLQKIHQAAGSGADLVNRILAFSRKADIKPRPLNLNRQIEQAATMLARTIPKMIEIELSLSDELATVNADPGQVEQILMNLAVNAGDAMPEGGRLTFETNNVALDKEYCAAHLGVKPGDYVMLSVSDTGHGMDPETLTHIFEPFYTTKGPGKGTGLGLAMVYGSVKQHGGHVTCYSEPGKGSTFRLYFPVNTTEAESDTSGEKPILVHGTETILLVDDEMFVRDLGRRMLERAGYTVLAASNGREAVSLYEREKNRIALVILDLMMPDMGGKECFRNLREIDPGVQVLIASGHASGETLTEAAALGAKGFVGKPYNMAQLLGSVRDILDAG
ncbi:MAG: PAS domain S-box protein [Desulfomonilaceae bacterium]|nr:PAS domain S-box protein [Desulfomonilaceae bacterium]